MDRKQIENLTASLAVVLLFALTVTGIVFIADLFFQWDIFPPNVERFLGFIMVSSLVIIISSVLVNLMINLGMIALNVEEFVQTYERNTRKK